MATLGIRDDKGHLYCEDCKSFSCKHIQVMIDNGDDSVILDEMLSSAAGGGGWFPIFVSVDNYFHFDLTVQCIVNPVNNTVGSLSISHYKQGQIMPLADNEFVGFINAGEGRKIILSMLDNFIFGYRPKLDMYCKEGTHSYDQEMAFQDHMNKPQLARLEVWSFYRLEKCYSCAKGTAGDFNDLIPPDERTRPRF